MPLSSLPDDAYPKMLDVGDSVGEHAIGSTSLEAFVRERVLEHRGAAPR